MTEGKFSRVQSGNIGSRFLNHKVKTTFSVNMDGKLAFLKSLRNNRDLIVPSIPYTVGRNRTANLILAHVNVSRSHCTILKEDQLWKLDDHSSSGTYVNDALVGRGKSVSIRYGDVIRFGPPESNLLWTFFPLDSTCKWEEEMLNEVSLIKPRTQIYLSFSAKKDEVSNEPIKTEENNLSSFIDVKMNATVSAQHNETKEIGFKQLQTKVNEEAPVKETKSMNVASMNQIAEKDEIEKAEDITKDENVEVKMESVENHNLNTSTARLVDLMVDTIETELQCTICSELFVTAVTLNCAHSFCKFCIQQWKAKQKNCPICWKKITYETRSLALDNYIDTVVEKLSEDLKNRREALVAERSNTQVKKKSRGSKRK